MADQHEAAADKPSKEVAGKAGGARAGRPAAKRVQPRPPKRLPAPADVEHPWLDSYPPGVPQRYEYPLVAYTRLLDDAAQDFPHATALDFWGSTLTYRELLDQVDRFATALRGLGVAKGDRVGLLLPTCPQHVVALHAVLRLGAVVCEYRADLGVAELERAINRAGPRVLVCADDTYPKLAQLKGRLRGVRHVVGTSARDALTLPQSLLDPLRARREGRHQRIPDSEGVLRFAALVSRTAPAVAQTAVDPENDVAVLMASAHTPERVAGLTHLNLVANAFQARLWMPDVQAGRENVLCALPLSEPAGLTLGLSVGMLSASTLTLLPRFDAGRVTKAIEKRGPTLFPGQPGMYADLVDAPRAGKRDLGSLRACLSTGGSLDREVIRRFEELTGSKLRQGYGLGEATALSHANPIYGKAKPGSVGLPVTDTVCLLVDLDDPRVPAAPGAPGELAVAGPQVMRGYWDTDDSDVLRDGWLLTGDIAEMDADGYLFVRGRRAR